MSEHQDVARLQVVTQLSETYAITSEALVGTFAAVAMPRPHTKGELISCLMVAREHGLNPLTKEIYFMKTRAGAIQPIVSVDGWIKKCNQHPQFDGMEIEDDRDASGKLTGMFCAIYRKDRTRPTRIREDLAECKAAGGPVWKSSEYRMMRNRVICQCARIAFGFAGIMDPDEFEAWQRDHKMRDVTPAKPAQLTIPDIPDEPATEVTQQAPDEFEPIADPDGVLSKLSEDIALCDSAAELAEVAEQYADLIPRLPAAHQKRARKLIDEAGE